MIKVHSTAEQSLNRLSISDNVISLPTCKHSKTSSHRPKHQPDETLIERITTSLQRTNATDHIGALLIFRLSEHQILVETFGESVGIKLTRLVTQRLQDCLRADDILEQVADDEFVIVLDRLNTMSQVDTITQRLIEHCTGNYVLAGLSLHVRTTAGVALYPADATEPTELMRYAHIALRQADAHGGYHFFSDDLLDQQRHHIQMSADIEQAIEQDRLVLHYQPQYTVDTRQIVAMEALVRLRSDTGELIPPNQFISIAEDNGLIIPIGHWVIRESCQQLKRWHQAGFESLRIAINVSPRQLVDERLVPVIREAVAEAGLEYTNIELEITEQCIVEQLPSVENVLHELNSMGVRIAIDDFGTGYSSLAYLSRLPVTAMKLDQSFLNTIPADPRSNRIVTAMIDMAKALQVEIIAEGVETQEQDQFLKDAGCHLGQGFGFARPQTADAVESLLKVYAK